MTAKKKPRGDEPAWSCPDSWEHKGITIREFLVAQNVNVGRGGTTLADAKKLVEYVDLILEVM